MDVVPDVTVMPAVVPLVVVEYVVTAGSPGHRTPMVIAGDPDTVIAITPVVLPEAQVTVDAVHA